MNLFEQLKSIPKVDMHINLTSSISTDLAFDLSDDTSILDVTLEMREKNILEYESALKLPIDILRTQKNTILAINDLIDRLESNNVIYGELFLDLPLYNRRINEEKLLKLVLDVIEERKFNLQVVLVLSTEREKEDNIKTIELLEKYYGHGVNGVYIKKGKMTNLSDYMYLFDRLNRGGFSYILNINSKLTSFEYEIYMKAKRIIYSLPLMDEAFLLEVRKNNIMLEFSITRLRESNIINDVKNYFIYDLIKENCPLTIASVDMTTLNTDILNEWCLMFNNYPLVLHDLVKIINNNLVMANIDNEKKDKLIIEFKEKSNIVL